MTDTVAATAPPAVYRSLAADDLDRIYALHLAATDAVGRPDLIKPETRDFFERILAGDGRVIGAFRGDALIGYGVLQLHLPPSEDARPQLGLEPADRLAKLAGASVLPGRWGGGIHDALISLRIAEARQLGVDHLYATSAPGNERSWPNLMASGFAIRAIMEKYGGHLRYLLHRREPEAAPGPDEGIWCAASDVAGQMAALRQGAIGLAWRRRPDGGRDVNFRLPS